jgi:hypothetical protein
MKASSGVTPPKIGIKHGFATESWLNINDGMYGMKYDNQWHQVTIPFSAFVPAIRFSSINIYFMFAQSVAPPKSGVYYLDEIYWTKK